MPTYMSNLFSYSRKLPAPFGDSPRTINVRSRYAGEGNTHATLSAPVIKAVHAWLDMPGGDCGGSARTTNGSIITEYRSSVPGKIHVVIYNPDTGTASANIADESSKIMTAYRNADGASDGTALHLALMPLLTTETEFSEALSRYEEMRRDGYPDRAEAEKVMALLCDNAYRRIKNNEGPAGIRLTTPRSGLYSGLPLFMIKMGKYEPSCEIRGEFTVLPTFGEEESPKPAGSRQAESVADFRGKYAPSERTLTAAEQAMVPELPAWYRIPEEVSLICRHIKDTASLPVRTRNFMLRGPAGTGKTLAAKAVAAGAGRPYLVFTCSSGTEFMDIAGTFLPVSETENAKNDLSRLTGMGGVTFENVKKLMELPDTDDIEFDPAGAYRTVTGIEKADATVSDCVEEILARVTERMAALLSVKDDGAQRYAYVESEIVRALREGYVIEIQEPTVITRPGVLVGLNSMLEQEGRITLPNGKTIVRHPDAIVMITTNLSYEDCRSMNQSVQDRMDLVIDMDSLSEAEMTNRAMAVTGEKDRALVEQMTGVVMKISEYCKKNAITDGTCGIRSLTGWILSARVGGNVYEAALRTVISKAAADPDDREAIITTCLDPVFGGVGS